MIHVMLVDDHRVLSDGIKAILSKAPDIQIVAQAADGHAALSTLQNTPIKPQIVVTDLEMKGMNGLILLQHLATSHPNISTIILTQHAHYQQEAMKTGAKGYLLKETGSDEIIRAIYAVAAGETYLDPYFHIKVTATDINAIPEFTTRELHIIRLITDELTTREIAERLHIPFSAVETYTRNIRRKTGATNIAGIVKFAIKHGLVD